MRKILITSVLFIYGFLCFGQKTYPTRDSIHVFWQPDLKITFQDYKGTQPKQVEALMANYGYSASASVGIWSALDIPRKKKDRSKIFEKVYFAPAFNCTTSFAITNDTLQIAMQNAFLDICEICARWARQQLTQSQDSIKAPGTLTLMYTTVIQKMDEKRFAMFRSYYKEVFIDKKKGAFVDWRALIDKGLRDTKGWATKPEECYRLMTGKPIEVGYIIAPAVIDPSTNKK